MISIGAKPGRRFPTVFLPRSGGFVGGVASASMRRSPFGRRNVAAAATVL